MTIILRIIAGWLALAFATQGQTLVSDVMDWPAFTRWAGPLAPWFVFTELVHVIGGAAGSVLLWRLRPKGRLIAIFVTVVDGLHSVVPSFLGPAFGVDSFRMGGSDVFGVGMSIAG